MTYSSTWSEPPTASAAGVAGVESRVRFARLKRTAQDAVASGMVLNDQNPWGKERDLILSCFDQLNSYFVSKILPTQGQICYFLIFLATKCWGTNDQVHPSAISSCWWFARLPGVFWGHVAQCLTHQ